MKFAALKVIEFIQLLSFVFDPSVIITPSLTSVPGGPPLVLALGAAPHIDLLPLFSGAGLAAEGELEHLHHRLLHRCVHHFCSPHTCTDQYTPLRTKNTRNTF